MLILIEMLMYFCECAAILSTNFATGKWVVSYDGTFCNHSNLTDYHSKCDQNVSVIYGCHTWLAWESEKCKGCKIPECFSFSIFCFFDLSSRKWYANDGQIGFFKTSMTWFSFLFFFFSLLPSSISDSMSWFFLLQKLNQFVIQCHLNEIGKRYVILIWYFFKNNTALFWNNHVLNQIWFIKMNLWGRNWCINYVANYRRL